MYGADESGNLILTTVATCSTAETQPRPEPAEQAMADDFAAGLLS